MYLQLGQRLVAKGRGVTRLLLTFPRLEGDTPALRHQAGRCKAAWYAGAVALCFLSIFAGCGSSTYDACIIGNNKTPGARASYQSCDLQRAAAIVAVGVDKQTADKDASQWGPDSIILLLEQGAILRAAGQFEQSNKALAMAAEKIDYYDGQAEISISEEANSVLVNQAKSRYRGRVSDRIMLGTYRALNFLQTGQFDKARPAFKYASEAQEDLVEKNRERSEKIQEKLNKDPRAKVQVATDATPNANYPHGNEIIAAQSRAEEAKKELDARAPEASCVTAYRNPYMVYLQALYLIASPDVQDHEHARSLLKSLGDSNDASRFIAQDLDAIAGLEKGKPLSSTTYVFFETGVAPSRIALPLFIPFQLKDPTSGVMGTRWCPAMYPMLDFQKDDDCLSHLQIRAGSSSEAAVRLANMDTIIAREFKDELPLILMKTKISIGIKAGVSRAVDSAQSYVPGQQMVYSALKAGVHLWSNTTYYADLRTWSMLPKAVEFCRISTPENHQLTLTFPSTGQQIPVVIEPGTVNLILVKAINPTTRPTVSQVKLK